MTDEPHLLTAVAFVRSTGGAVRVLFAVDRGAQQLHDGEPAILVEHRPGAAADAIEIECAELVPDGAAARLRTVADELTELIEGAFDDTGAFVGDRLLGRQIQLLAPADAFALDQKS